MDTASPNVGRVVLCGAGAGDAGLLGARAARWLARADVVVHDRLVSADVLALVPEQAELIDVGKRPGAPRRAQQDIHALLIDRARAGKLVVRLKGGDPFVFGRGGEEAEALRAAGVPYRVVPGVTAALAAAADADVPLTDRRRAASVTLLTARETPDKPSPTLDWSALARLDTLVIYMSVGALETVVRRLIDAGRSAATPAAAVERAGTSRSRTIRATLAALPARARAARLAAPAVLIVGPTAAQPQPAAAASPLAGQTVLVTRPPAQAQELVERFADAGAAVCLAPAISIAPPASYDALDAAVADLGAFDWLAATSVNGVAAVFARLAATGRDARALGGVAVAAVGPATADALAERGIRADLVAEPHTTSALAEALERQGLTGRRVLLPRADIAPPELADRLAAAGADVTEVAAYRTLRAAALPDDAVVELRAGRIDWITATSASCATNLAALAREAGIDLTGVKLAAIGPVTNRALRAAGLNAAVVADLHTTDGLVGAMVRFSNCQGPSDAPAQAGGA